MSHTGFAAKVRELLKNEGTKTPREIIEICGYLSKPASNGDVYCSLKRCKDIHYLGSVKLGVYYLDGQEELAKKNYEKLKKEREESRKKCTPFILPPNPNINSVLDCFPDDKTEHTLDEVHGIVGGHKLGVASRLNRFVNVNVLILTSKKPKKYARNPQYSMICDGDYKKASRELFKDHLR
jgi:hypothetical protein